MVAPLTGSYSSREFKRMLRHTGGPGGVCLSDVIASAIVQFEHTGSGMMGRVVALPDSSGRLCDATGRRFALEDDGAETISQKYTHYTAEDNVVTLEASKLYLLEVGTGSLSLRMPESPQVGDSVVMVCYSSYGSQPVSLDGNGHNIQAEPVYGGMLAGMKYEFVFTGDETVGWATCQAM